jgi:hypothetical protein
LISDWIVRNASGDCTVRDVANHFQISLRSVERALVVRAYPTARQLLRTALVERATSLHGATQLSWHRVAALLRLPPGALAARRCRLK